MNGDAAIGIGLAPPLKVGRPSWVFAGLKRGFDLTVAIILLVPLIVVSSMVLIANPFFNEGRLFFIQKRMGKGTQPFFAIKFRTMTDVGHGSRGAHDPVEKDRITPLGHFLRKTRIDELPQIINVLRGEMSLIGPRPDYYEHALEYLETVPGYGARHIVRPGISGYAQIKIGYAATPEAVAAKVNADLHYIRNRRTRLEAWIFWRTLVIVFHRRGV